MNKEEKIKTLNLPLNLIVHGTGLIFVIKRQFSCKCARNFCKCACSLYKT